MRGRREGKGRKGEMIVCFYYRILYYNICIIRIYRANYWKNIYEVKY